MRQVMLEGMVALWLLFVPAADAQEKLKVVCTLPTLEAIVREVGGDRVEAISLAKGYQDPHFVSPTPVLMKKAREADFLVEVGLTLELWADEVANGSGNPRIFRAGKGRVVASTGLPLLEVPRVVSREFGDLHPQGNPHVWLEPLRAKQMAENISQAFQQAAPADREYFEARLKAFQERIDRSLFGKDLVDLVGSRKLARLAWDGQLFAFLEQNEVNGRPLSEKLGGWLRKAAPLRGLPVVEYHRVWIYLADLLGMHIRATVEERPGIPPGPQYQRRLVEQIKQEGIRLLLVDNFYSLDLPRHIARETGARVVVLPSQVGGEKGVDSYFALIDHILDRMLEGVAGI